MYLLPSFICHSPEFKELKKFEKELQVTIKKYELRSGLKTKFPKEIEEYYGVFIEAIYNSLKERKINKNEITKMPPPAPPIHYEKFNSFAELNMNIISRWKSMFLEIYQKECIPILEGFEKVLLAIDELSIRERLIFKLSVINYSDQQIADQLKIEKKEITPIKENLQLTIYGKLPLNAMTYFNTFIEASRFTIMYDDYYVRSGKVFFYEKSFLKAVN